MLLRGSAAGSRTGAGAVQAKPSRKRKAAATADDGSVASPARSSPSSSRKRHHSRGTTLATAPMSLAPLSPLSNSHSTTSSSEDEEVLLGDGDALGLVRAAAAAATAGRRQPASGVRCFCAVLWHYWRRLQWPSVAVPEQQRRLAHVERRRHSLEHAQAAGLLARAAVRALLLHQHQCQRRLH